MEVYRFSVHPDAVAGAFDWSENKKKRRSKKGAVRWYPTDSDGFPLGPLPDDLKAKMATHWALTGLGNDWLPDFFNSNGPHHFTGLQAVGEKLADIYRMRVGDDLELVPIPNFWSLADEAEIAEPYYLANVFASAETIDLARSEVIEVKNPKLAGAQKYMSASQSNKWVKNVRGFKTDLHVWRDANTSEWFCDEEFKAEMDAASPGNFMFLETAEE
ncbi:imm11 family protein [Pseudooceanicola atlanticus]|uniref:Immunity MXAN-0049 protein domain-containing protein n=1 Tax=Pseudooceanicola atlanticus TaxID=1461694 RepID=A0A0A0EB50_9RHOB|nr:DUF1629 domain-containing protein [Pseudooceanicola atlanticus]KGM47445.1 hypothetical protein ATO9_17585 [Pseudooceanicola atlanticus]